MLEKLVLLSSCNEDMLSWITPLVMVTISTLYDDLWLVTMVTMGSGYNGYYGYNVVTMVTMWLLGLQCGYYSRPPQYRPSQYRRPFPSPK